MGKVNWFQRHVNWTTMLFILPGLFLMGISNAYSQVGLYFIGLAMCLPVLIWALKEKKRSLWWILILFVPFGWIVFLCLENRSELIDLKNGVITKIKSGENGTAKQ